MTFVRLETEDRIAVVTLSRPETLNAVSGDVADELAAAFRDVAAAPETWAMVLRAEGEKAFCVGADLKERARMDDQGWLRNRGRIRGLFDALRDVEQPTIAAVFGYALGGGFELALNCDFIVAAEDAEFGLPETGVGIVPGGGGTQQLPRKVGMTRAKEIILAGRRLTAGEALEWGLASRVVSRRDLDEAAMEMAREIGRNSPVAVRHAKDAIQRGVNVPMAHGIEIEDFAWHRAVESEDRREGIAAFSEKRKPRWKGR